MLLSDTLVEFAPDSPRPLDREHATRPRGFAWLELALWIGLWLAARSLLLLSFADVFGYGEELQKACAGKAMLDGLAVPHYQLAYHYYEGGGFVISHLDALAFVFFGESIMAVKIVALAFGAAILAAGWGLVRRAGGLGAARIFALLFVLAPDSVQRNSLLTLGIHSHALLFMACILWATVRLAFERDLWPRTWLSWGISAGFGFYFSYQCSLTIAVSIAALVVCLRRDLVSRTTAWAFVGLAIGLAPLFWMIAHVHWAVLDIHGAGFVDLKTDKLEVIRQFCLSVFSDRAWIDSLAVIGVAITPAIALAALARGAARPVRFGARLVLANMALFLAAYVGSGFTVSAIYHYIVLQRLLPLWFLSILALALGASAALASQRLWLRGLACLCVAIPAISGAADLVRTVGEGAGGSWAEHFRELAHAKGYSYTGYLEKLAGHLDGSRAHKVEVMLGFREPEPTLLQSAIAVALYGDGQTSIRAIGEELRSLGIHAQRGFWLGFGPLLAKQMKEEPGDLLNSALGADEHIMVEDQIDVAERVRRCADRPAEERDLLIEAIGRWGQGDPVTQDRVLREGNLAIKAELPEAYFRGLGQRIYRASGVAGSRRYFQIRSSPWSLDREHVHSILEKCPDPPAGILFDNYEAERAVHSLGSL
jgi:hypothetical protein